TGETATYTLEVTASDPLSITLAWTDYPGTPAAAGGLVNDLDLKVEGPGGMTYYPNNASQRGAVEDLFYGPLNTVVYNNSGYRAERFTPTSYPVTLDKAVLVAGSVSGSYPKTFTYYVYNDDVTSGPGTVLASGTATIRRSSSTQYDWKVIDLSGDGVTITDGHFYIGFQIPDIDFTYGEDIHGSGGRGWSNTDGFWLPSPVDFSIHAIVKSADTSTDYDRVNNLVGIDIASPATGIYTLTVDGYNVPQGPQNYALVVSGVGRLLGTETVTRTIPSIGTYKFGNTGVTVEFTDENVDAVAVTAYRDQYHPSGGEGVKRYYRITPIGGTGVFTANVVFSYEQAEFEASGIAYESALEAWRWSGGSWESVTGAVDTASNVVTVTGVTAFSDWTLSDQNPTAVALSSFTAEWDDDEVQVAWETALEIDTVGFNLWRSTAPGGYERVNAALIPAASPGGVWGGSYAYADADVTPGATYDYKLEELEVGGARNWYGPVSTGGSGPNAVIFAGAKTRMWDDLALVLGVVTLATLARLRRRR
ncbi:MAG: hypothetical protein JXA14_08670, partial [Anaerolineae bacterium]|nr:hypothetical protein [Anaerolineae bacterium]